MIEPGLNPQFFATATSSRMASMPLSRGSASGPAAVFLGKISGPELVWGLWIELAWVLTAWGLARLTFRLGVRHYSGFGG